MLNRIAVLVVACCAWAGALAAQEVGSASGKGMIERIVEPKTGKSEQVTFQPRYSFAYPESTGAEKFTWIVLTEKEPPLKSWAAAKDRAEARRLWCGTEKTPFVAVKLDADWKVDLYFLCPANGWVNTEMVNTANGLDSVVVELEVRDAKRLKGTLRTGQGACGDTESMTYCEATGDYTFDAPLSK
ncbi:MAG: hypothetical protein QOH06_4851 [Acidobacteriota bacterium]|jgi:hypothetical protein|nr:hypothetical protein [Acidobacteriota bacterium]